MLAELKEKGYFYVKDFFTKEELAILQPYCLDKSFNPTEESLKDPQSPGSPSYGKDVIMNALLKSKKEKMEKVSNLKLFQTYSYWRGYNFGSILETHQDRPSCEISVTAAIDSCGIDWPIHMGENWISIKPGDAVMYLGCDVPHGRKPFEGRYCAQVFLHYVNAEGPYAVHRYDQVLEKLGVKN